MRQIACSLCEAPSREFWPPTGTVQQAGITSKLSVVDHADYHSGLLVCPQCGSLWFEIVEEPHAAFPYLVSWPFTVVDWERLFDRDNGQTLSRWHAGRIRAIYPTLSDADRDIIERHRRRIGTVIAPVLDPSRTLGPDPDLASLLRD